MPNDKSDLIEKVINWAQKPGSTILKRVEELHPDILDRVKQRLSIMNNIHNNLLIELHVPDLSVARSFYEKLGFKAMQGFIPMRFPTTMMP